ncbi:MAG TPA: hypothetical protein VKF28_06620 [Candidatus Dormibacteraeota bacterium]|nr:hypothetical protein [Candidatus Dormibacteraeota bacterium]
MQPESAVLIGLAAAALAFAVIFTPVATSRRALLVKGGTGLVGSAAIASVPSFDLSLLILLSLGVLHAAIEGPRVFAVRLRAPVVAVATMAIALVFAHAQGSDAVQRFAAVGLVAGLAAAVGLLPYMHPLEPDEPMTSSPIPWIAFVGPVLGAVVVFRAQQLLGPDAGGVFGGMLIGLGLLNIAWGSVSAWLTESEVAAWRYSFVADWGLVLCGFGVTLADGGRAALLVLFSIVVGRLPLYIASRQALRDRSVAQRPINFLVAGALAGSAPFVGFVARILLLRAATQLYWPLALALAFGMLLWLPGSLRLGRSLAVPRGRQAIGVSLVLALNVAAGLYPLPILLAARL